MDIINRIKKLFRFEEPKTITINESPIIHTISREELIKEAKKYVEAHRKDKKC
jgi:hypothetical protein